MNDALFNKFNRSPVSISQVITTIRKRDICLKHEFTQYTQNKFIQTDFEHFSRCANYDRRQRYYSLWYIKKRIFQRC